MFTHRTMNFGNTKAISLKKLPAFQLGKQTTQAEIS
jgi:hypothetical protein